MKAAAQPAPMKLVDCEIRKCDRGNREVASKRLTGFKTVTLESMFR